jgi:dihydropteroate synthase
MDVRIIEIQTADDAAHAINAVGADPYAVRLMADKAYMRTILLNGVDNRAANLIKQEMLALGGEAAVNRYVSSFKTGASSVLIMGTEKQLKSLLSKLSRQPFGLKHWHTRIQTVLSQYERRTFSLTLGNRKVTLGADPLVMGILNITPDSFSDGGAYLEPDDAFRRAEEMAAQGADIIDIGGESTRPGSAVVSAEEERARVVPVIKLLKKRLRLPLSIDTYKPEVARAALDAGAAIVNDIAGLCYDRGAMAKVVKQYGVPVIVMHMKGKPATMAKNARYNDVVSEINDFFSERITFARSEGIREDRLILDPGIGFGKTLAHNLEILRRLKEFKVLGLPIAVGLSRKRFIGKITGVTAPAERQSGSIAAALWAALQGAHIVRVHDVEETAQALKVLAAIRG